MLPIESVFCPCCTPALLHTLAQTNLARIPQQVLWLGTGALAATLKRQQEAVRSPRTGRKSIVRNAGTGNSRGNEAGIYSDFHG